MQDYQVMPPLSAEEYNELKNDIAARGVMVPIEYDEHGNVLDGHHRLQICAELGIRDFPKVIRAGMTEEEKRTHARKLNMARRQLSREQRQRIIDDALRENPEKSDRQIGRELGVDNKTVASRRGFLEAGEEIPHLDTTTGADGKQYPRQVARNVQPIDFDEEFDDYKEYRDDEAKQALYQLDELMDEHPVLRDLIQERPSLDELIETHDGNEPFYDHARAAVAESEKAKPHVTNNSGCNEWYTPEKYIDLAREVLGEIDLDPASCAFANKTVKARLFYSEDDDGLTKPWHGRVWMNPPYSADLVLKFAEKFVNEYNDGNVTEGIVLVNNATETAWFASLVNAATAVCFPRGRIRYQSQTRESLAPLQGQAFLYFGENGDKFLQVFSEIGWGAVIYG